MIGAFFRRLSFWIIDFFKGKPIRREYKDIQNIFENNVKQDEALRNILSYAIKNVPFYSNIEKPELSYFPVMNKLIFKEQKENCYSSEFSDREKLYKASTSGSTGTPLVVYQDLQKRLRHRAEYLFYNEKIGWRLGDHYVFIRNWASNYRQSAIKNFIQNATNISVAEFNDEKKKWLCSHLKHRKRSILFGYSSSICDFLTFVKKNDISADELSIKLIVCDSDELSNQNKHELEKVFQCPVINRYDNEENGFVATTFSDSTDLTVNFPSLYVELLKIDSDQPTLPGEVGRVVVTDLYNHAMPLIRYDIGDLAVSEDDFDSIRTLKEFSGRKSDCIYSTTDVLISNVAISAVTEIFYDIERYQIVQEQKNEYVFKYTGTLSEDEHRELLNRLYDCLGRDAHITIDNTDTIEVGLNGKHKSLVNKIH